MDMPLQTLPAPHVLTPWSVESIGGLRGSGSIPNISGGAASANWPVANMAFLYPFVLHSHEIVRKLLRLNGATLTGTVDVGIYDGEGRLIVAAGSTAAAGTNAIQEFNIADTPLGPGRYFLAASASATGATIFLASMADDHLGLASIYEAASSHALPATITPVVSTQASPPLVCIGAQFTPTP